MIPAEVFYIIGGALVGFGLGDIYRYLTRPERPNRPVADGWDNLTHVRVVDRDPS